jgi:16S rRNA processing protein RimM
VTAAGDPYGQVIAVPDYGGGALLEVAPAGGGRPCSFPSPRPFVPAVDLAAGRVVVEPPAEGPEDER